MRAEDEGAEEEGRGQPHQLAEQAADQRHAERGGKGRHSIGGNQTIGGGFNAGRVDPQPRDERRRIETKMTRRYCMKATRRWSAPNAPAISTMAVAAPGDEPQTAVVPGRILQRLISQPSKLDAASVASTTTRNSGHSLWKAEKMSARSTPRSGSRRRPGRRRTAGAARAPSRRWCRQGWPQHRADQQRRRQCGDIPARRRTAARRPAAPATAEPGACAPCVRRPAGLARGPSGS